MLCELILRSHCEPQVKETVRFPAVPRERGGISSPEHGLGVEETDVRSAPAPACVLARP